MSYLNEQISDFKTSVNSSSARFAQRRGVNPISKDPATSQDELHVTAVPRSVAPQQLDPVPHVGSNVMTQITYAIEHLKTRGAAMSLDAILSYLSLQHREPRYKHAIGTILMNHDRVEFIKPESSSDYGTYRFKPTHSIKTVPALLQHMQSQSSGHGLSVRELRDGWPEVESSIDALENQGRLLVTRNKKDNHAKMIWPNDASLNCQIDAEFQTIWHRIKLPDAEKLVADLESAGLTPASKNMIQRRPAKMESQNRKRRARKGGKTTNTHMTGVLRDYSHMKR